MKRKKPKNKIYFPSHAKNLDNAKLLFTDPEFHGEIKGIRRYVGIPLNGFDVTDERVNEKVEKWTNEYCQHSEEMMNSKEMKEELKAIQEREKKGEITNEEAKEIWREAQTKIPVNYLTRNILRLITDYNLPPNYEQNIHRHILFDEINAPPTPFVEHKTREQLKHPKSVTLEFFTKLSNEDLTYIKWYVNELVGKELPDYRPLKEIDLKITTEKVYENRKSFDYTDQKDYKMTTAEIINEVKERTKKKIKPDSLYEYPRELKDLRKKRFKKSGKEEAT